MQDLKRSTLKSKAVPPTAPRELGPRLAREELTLGNREANVFVGHTGRVANLSRGARIVGALEFSFSADDKSLGAPGTQTPVSLACVGP